MACNAPPSRGAVIDGYVIILAFKLSSITPACTQLGLLEGPVLLGAAIGARLGRIAPS